MDRFIAGMKRHAAALDGQTGQPRWGIVASVDATGGQVRVRVRTQPEDVLSGWLPVLYQSAGPGAFAGIIPVPGWVAFVQPDLGDAEHGVVTGFAHNDAGTLPPSPVVPGTGGVKNSASAPYAAGAWVLVANGSVIRLSAVGDIFLSPGSGIVKIDGNLTVNGYIRADGAITAGYGSGASVGLQTHTHTQPPDSRGDTEAATAAPTAGT